MKKSVAKTAHRETKDLKRLHIVLIAAQISSIKTKACFRSICIYRNWRSRVALTKPECSLQGNSPEICMHRCEQVVEKATICSIGIMHSYEPNSSRCRLLNVLPSNNLRVRTAHRLCRFCSIESQRVCGTQPKKETKYLQNYNHE